MNLLAFVSVGRSGHNAVMRWLVKHLQGSVVLCTECQDPALGKRLLLDQIESAEQADWHVWDLENFDRDEASELVASKRAVYDKVHTVILVRDYLNWLASFMWRIGPSPSDPGTFIWLKESKHTGDRRLHDEVSPIELGAWLDIVRTYTDVWVSHALALQDDDETACCVLFNKWFTDMEYRKAILAKLDIAFDPSISTDKVELSRSSFDSQQMPAADLAVLKRYEQVVSDWLYIMLLRENRAAAQLSSKIFDMEFQ